MSNGQTSVNKKTNKQKSPSFPITPLLLLEMLEAKAIE